MYQEFDFTVAEMTEAQAENLLTMITSFAEQRGLEIAGGFHTATDADYPEAGDVQENLDQLRTGKEFLSYAQNHGADVRNGLGSHMVVSTDRGQCVVPVHATDLGKGLRCKIVKTFALIGLGLMPLACLIAAMLSN